MGQDSEWDATAVQVLRGWYLSLNPETTCICICICKHRIYFFFLWSHTHMHTLSFPSSTKCEGAHPCSPQLLCCSWFRWRRTSTTGFCILYFKSTTQPLKLNVYREGHKCLTAGWYIWILQGWLKILIWLLSAFSFLWILILRCWPYVVSHAFNISKSVHAGKAFNVVHVAAG